MTTTEWRGRMPRHYAADILKLTTREERRAYLETEVPEEIREWVRFYVLDWWWRKKHDRRAERLPAKHY